MTFTLKNSRNWHRWFAWHPVRVYLPSPPIGPYGTDLLPPKTYHWLCYVERRNTGFDGMGLNLWEYRPATPTT